MPVNEHKTLLELLVLGIVVIGAGVPLGFLMDKILNGKKDS